MLCGLCTEAEAKHHRHHLSRGIHHGQPQQRAPAPADAPPASTPVAGSNVEQAPSTPDVHATAPQPSLPPSLLARMHPALVHLPIGWLMALLLCEIGVLLLGQFRLRGVGPYLCLMTTLSFVPTMLSGLARAEELEEPLKMMQAAEHRNVMICTFCLLVCATVLRLRRPDQIRGLASALYLALLVMSALCLGVGAHLGGQMVFGAGYLPF